MSQKVITSMGLLHHAELREENRRRKQRGKSRSILQILKDLVFSYLQKSSIHGLKSLADSNQNLFQRFFSTTVVLFCLILACINIASSYHTYEEAAHITVMKSDSVHISSIPFPGIAVCNANTIKKSALVKMAGRMKGNANMSFEETYHILESLSQLRDVRAMSVKDQMILDFLLTHNNQEHNLTALVNELSHSCDKMIKSCVFRGIITPCKNLFIQSSLPDGRSCCVSKNSVVASESEPSSWFLEWSSELSGLSMILDLEIDEYLPGSQTFGAEILIFDPRSHPYSMTYGVSSIMASYKEATFISIDPSVDNNTYAAGDDGDTVCKRTMPSIPSLRGLQEKILYSVSECQFRCIMIYLFQPCECHLYKHRRFRNHDFEECSMSGLNCVSNYGGRNNMKDFNSILEDCGCAPTCESVLYQTSTYNLVLEQAGNSTSVNESHVFIYFENIFVNSYDREPIYTSLELFVQIIGHCSLFFGASLASIVELIYFFTLRLLCELYTNQERKKDAEKRKADMKQICGVPQEGNIDCNEILDYID